MLKNIFFISVFFLGFSNCLADGSFEEQWHKAQKEYVTIKNQYKLYKYDLYCHPFWEKNRCKLEQIINGAPNKNFLNGPVISSTMVWRGFPKSNEYEEIYLKHCISGETKKKLKRFKDTNFLPHKCRAFDCSFGSLVHLFYAATSLEALRGKEPKNIVEFGGGYGNLARIFKMMVPESTIFIIDLPELIVFQAIFLRSTLPGKEVIIHSKAPESFAKGTINLIPVYLLEDIDVKADVFISTFAISETTERLQNLVFKKRFFDADVCYIVGQLNGWGKVGFEGHSFIHSALRNSYRDVKIQPFHVFLDGDFKSYEAIAVKN